MSQLKVNSIIPVGGLGTGANGGIVQCVYVKSTTHQTSTSTSYVDLSGITATITPSSNSNKILICCSIAISKYNNHSFIGRMLRDGSAIAGSGGVQVSGQTGQDNGVWWNLRNSSYSTNPSTVWYLDSPATTSAVTYKAQGLTTSSSYGFALNRTVASENVQWVSPTASTVILYEISV